MSKDKQNNNRFTFGEKHINEASTHKKSNSIYHNISHNFDAASNYTT